MDFASAIFSTPRGNFATADGDLNAQIARAKGITECSPCALGALLTLTESLAASKAAWGVRIPAAVLAEAQREARRLYLLVATQLED
mgnify:CR=1 FL=1